jgi:glycosyltransferase involved in cell wall biosynthesis
MATPLVSIIVPAFNVAPHLTQCLDSLILQDLQEIEIIVIDDGSTDQTAEIASRYAASHAKVRLTRQENQGLSGARNVGMHLALGAFFGFVDGDDWIHPSMYRDMLEAAERTNADLVVTNGYLYNDATKAIAPIQDFRIWESLGRKGPVGAFAPKSEPDAFLLDTSACKRLYRRSFLKDLAFEFPYGKIFEDVSTHYKLFLRSGAVALVDRRFYYYRTHRPGRITSRKGADLLHIFDVLDQVIEVLTEERASDEIWANFIWFQNWVLRWLKVQIDPEHAERFNIACTQTALLYPRAAIDRFREKFAADQKALEFIASLTNDGVRLP